MATDLALGLPDDSPAAAVEAGTLGGLETFEAGVLSAAEPMEPLALETESFFETPPVTEQPPEPHAEPETIEDAAPEPAPAFVTETMATLYLQQGHLESALDIYRKLVDLRPEDAGLRARLQAVEDQVFGSTVSMETAEAAPESETRADAPVELSYAAPAPTYGGPTIREFLAGIVSRRTPVYSEPVATPELEPEAEPDVAEPAAVGEHRPTPSSSETVSGSIGALFSGADAAAADTNAANALAEAFAPEGPETAPLVGRPAHRASSELSLNHVFKAGEPRPNQGDGFSFDQFFSETAEEQPPQSTDTPASGTPEATDDIAQFNAWLNGLKKT
jgi:hypothetical protein